MGINTSHIKAILRDSYGNKRNDFVRVLNMFVVVCKASPEIDDYQILKSVQELLDINYDTSKQEFIPIKQLSKDVLLALARHPSINKDPSIFKDLADDPMADQEVYQAILDNDNISDDLRKELNIKLDEEKPSKLFSAPPEVLPFDGVYDLSTEEGRRLQFATLKMYM